MSEHTNLLEFALYLIIFEFFLSKLFLLLESSGIPFRRVCSIEESDH